ncbi:MAG: nuclear transport factor 2 family protein [bacterium]
MHPNAALITRFYTAFQASDGEAMAACYADDVHFSDPVFPDLEGAAAGDMWRMLTAAAKDLRIEFSGVEADDARGKAHWEAWYTFSATGKKVHNIIDAEFTFRDGRITRHADTFSFPRWAGQALGFMGKLLGKTGWLQRKVQGQAGAGLRKFRASREKA